MNPKLLLLAHALEARGIAIVEKPEAPAIEHVLSKVDPLPPKTVEPACYKPEREWWRGIDPRRQRKLRKA